MNILFVTPPPYLPNRLHRVRSFDLIKILAKNHSIYLLAVTTQKKYPKEFEEIKKICQFVKVIRISKLKALLNCFIFPLLPSEVAYCHSPKVTEELKKIIRQHKIDLLYLKRLRSAIYLPKFNLPVIIDSTDAMSMFYFRMFKHYSSPKKILYYLEAIRYKNFEVNIMTKFKKWVVCSEVDRKYLMSLRKNIQINVIPNPVDINYFSPQNLKSVPNTILFRGLMDKPVNIDAALFFVNEILSFIKAKIRNVKLYIVGPKPSAKIKNLQNGSIFVLDFVPDIANWISKTSLSVCPVRIGSGVRYKILQAWALKRPVVSTRLGAEGLNYVNGQNIEIADNPKAFALKVIEILTNKKLYNKLAKNGYRTVMEEYSYHSVQAKLEKILLQATNDTI